MTPHAQPTVNPFKPTAGKMPPELIGRNEMIGEFYNGLSNGAGAPERLVRLTGARGMGKTVMLSEFRKMALQMGGTWSAISETAAPGFTTRIMDALSGSDSIGRVHLQPSAFGASLGSVDLDRSSLDLRGAMEKATQKGHGLIITLDEVQDASMDELRALAIAIQHMITDDRNIVFAFAGLPSLIDKAINGPAVTFLRRAVPFALGRIPVEDVAFSLRDTMSRLGSMQASEELVSRMADYSQGYPFMIQLVGYYTWQAAFERMGRKTGVLKEEDVEKGNAQALKRFFDTVLDPAIQHLPVFCIEYLQAMASLGVDPCRTGEVAERLGKQNSSTTSARERLLKEGLIEAPRFGYVAFAIPYMRRYFETSED